MRRAAGVYRIGEKIAQLRILLDQLSRGGAEPFGKGGVDENEAPGVVDRVEAGRRMVEEIGERRPLVAHFLVDRIALGDVLETPEACPIFVGEAMRRDAEPGKRPVGMRD